MSMGLEIISKQHESPTGKPTIVLIHGACMGAWVWEDNFVNFFYREGFEVFALSLTHHGKSDGVGKLRWTSIKQYVNDLTIVIDQINGPVYLIGHSMGGFTIQHYLHSPAKNVVGATLLCSAPSHGLWHLMGKLILHYPVFFLQSLIQLSWLPIMKSKKRLKRIMFREDFSDKQMVQVMAVVQEESFLAFLEMVFLRLPVVKHFTVPVQVIGAEKDYLISVADTKRMAVRYSLEPYIVKGASHCLMMETGWEEVAQYIKKFAAPHGNEL